MAGLVPADTLKDYIGKDMGESDWLVVDQDRINQFADATLDHQFIHVDSEKATPLFGSTIAHGFLSLSLMAGMPAPQVAPENMTMAFNYGLDRVRFLTPVNVGSKVRTKAKLLSVDDKGDGRYLVKNEVTMEIEGQEKPAYIAESLTMYVTA
ncbi:MaoC family dehydratase [SAR86 cluster bacterium]|jgi:acyl dehydratase|nr:protein dehydratase [Gammaproteobacteria bacterium]MDC3151141.1 MaoC family dehydratase [SAR86 cluster bacterium]|tara:strand:+ start:899 stop:1354 length:456 start_codon:yes stop_codon:yes gene_type:complete